MQLKRLFSSLLVASALLAACSPAATPAPTAVAPTTAPAATAAATAAATTAAAATSAPAATAASGAVTVQFWHVYSAGSAQQKAMDDLISKFNAANPDVQVVGTYQGSYPDIYKKITAAIAGNSLPDVAVSYQDDIANYIVSGAKVQPLDAWIADPKLGFTAADMADIYPAYIDKYPGSNNQVMSVAYNRSMEVMYYNADMLSAAGFSQPPASWDDFEAVCAKVSKAPNQYCYAITSDASRLTNWIWSRGGDLLSADGKTVSTGFHDQGLASLQFLNMLVTKNQAYLVAKQFGDQSDFAVGKAAFTFGSSAGIPFYATAVMSSTAPFKWGVAPAPHTTPNPVVDVYGPSVAIFNNGSDAKGQAAWRFVKYLMSPDANAEWVKTTSYFPARKSTLAQLSDFIGKNPLYGSLVANLPYGMNEPQIAAWNPIRTAMGDAMTAVASGASTPEDAMNTAVQKANAALAK